MKTFTIFVLLICYCNSDQESEEQKIDKVQFRNSDQNEYGNETVLNDRKQKWHSPEGTYTVQLRPIQNYNKILICLNIYRSIIIRNITVRIAIEQKR